MFEAFYGRASPTVDRLNRNIENIVEITRKRFLNLKNKPTRSMNVIVFLEN